MKKILVLVFLFKMSFAYGQMDVKLKLIQSFSIDVQDAKKNLSDVAKSHLCSINIDSKSMKLTLLQLKDLRERIRDRKIKIQSFNQIPIDERNLGNVLPGDVFRLLADDKFICFFLVKTNKINSFATMRKGSERIFLTLCDE